MRKRAASTLECLAHLHRALASRALLPRGRDVDEHLADVVQLRLPLTMGFADGTPQRGEGAERERAVFFPTA